VLRRAANHVLRLLLAPPCTVCGEVLDTPLEGGICSECWTRVVRVRPPWCARCGDLVAAGRPDGLCRRCRVHPPAFDIARSAAVYEGTLRVMIQAFKFDRQRWLAGPLGSLLDDCSLPLRAGIDAVVPVPQHPWRGLTRGFNPADDLAARLGAPVWRVLVRTRLGRPQRGEPAGLRQANVRAAFRATTRTSRRRPLAGTTVLLVDDVMTTGATLDACSRALRAAGVRSVRAATVARTVAGPALRWQPTPGRGAARRR